jgi:predicted metalloprotease
VSAAGAALAFLVGARAVSGPAPDDGPTVAFVNGVIASTTIPWTSALAARGMVYAPPRVLFLRMPAGHPARGNAYSSLVGLQIDLGDMRALGEIADPQARSVAAFIVAHEIGHHVQHLLSLAPGETALAPGAGRELQADCYAGWSLARASPPGGDARLEPWRSDVDVEQRLSRGLMVLGVLERGRLTLRRDAPVESDHGDLAQRVAAIRKGLALSTPWKC